MDTFLTALVDYFRAERNTGLLMVGVGLVAAAFAFHLWRSHEGAFRTAILVPALLVAAGGVFGGPVLAVRSQRQIDTYTAQYASAPAELLATEVPRMETVNANWSRLKMAWAVLALVALGLVFAGGREWTTGLGAALLFLAGMIMLIDVLAERRALVYAEQLTELARQLGSG